jgi:hypothetical protein
MYCQMISIQGSVMQPVLSSETNLQTHLQALLRNLDKSLNDYQGIPMSVVLEQYGANANGFIADKLSYPLPSAVEFSRMKQSLNADQREAYDRIKHSYETNSSEAYFIDGPAGTGKMLYSLILSMVRSNYHIAFAVAGSGITALLLQGGRTAHSRFKIPVLTHEGSVCSVGHISAIAELLIQAKIIVWDKALMTHRHIFDTADRTLQDLSTLRTNTVPLEESSWSLAAILDKFLQSSTKDAERKLLKSALNNPHSGSLPIIFHLSVNVRLLRNANAPDIEDQTEFTNLLLRVGEGIVPVMLS